MGKYADSPEWADVAPLLQEETVPAPLAQIAYSDEYAEAMSYLRAVMAADEKSERVLALTQDVINMNASHYTVWLYRAQTLIALSADLATELHDFLNPLSLKHLKNYQIWHHRQTVVARLGAPPADELRFLAQMFALDAKNYHVWSYRQWLVKQFAWWDSAAELAYVDQLLADDVRNNSAWNHRWHDCFARDPKQTLADAPRVQREADYAMAKIPLAPQNESPWNYLRGLLLRATGPAALERQKIISFAEQFAGQDGTSEPRSSHALDLLATLYAEDPAKRQAAVQALDALAEKWDAIRAPYWQYRKMLVNADIAASS